MRKFATAGLLWLSLAVTLTTAATAQTVIYVDASATGDDTGASWTHAFTDLQDALAAASSGDEIWVAAGTYRPTDIADRAVSFQLVADVAVYGGFVGTETARDQRDWETHVTILSGDIGTVDDNSDNSYHVVKGTSNAVLDGLTVTGGNADGSSPNDLGGGMHSSGATGLAVANCTFSGNSAGRGGGMCNYDSSLAVASTVSNCTFSGNTAGWDGGGVYNVWSFLTIANCTFSGNAAGMNGGGICEEHYFSTVTNCILWGNQAPTGPEIHVDSATCTVSYSDVAQVGGFTDGGGNVSADPLFVDADGPDGVAGTSDDDLHLQAGSPCIDSADGDAAPAADKDGNPRYDDPDTPDTGVGSLTYADMGAYEFQGETPSGGNGGGCAAGAGGAAGIVLSALAVSLALARRRQFA